MKGFVVVIKNGKKKIYINNLFTETKEDVREKAADIVLKQDSN
ncbi:hypothetical protein [Clostridium tertium]